MPRETHTTHRGVTFNRLKGNTIEIIMRRGDDEIIYYALLHPADLKELVEFHDEALSISIESRP